MRGILHSEIFESTFIRLEICSEERCDMDADRQRVTDLGILDIQLGGEPYTFISIHRNLAIFIKQRQWITLESENVL